MPALWAEVLVVGVAVLVAQRVGYRRGYARAVEQGTEGADPSTRGVGGECQCGHLYTAHERRGRGRCTCVTSWSGHVAIKNCACKFYHPA